MENKTEKVAENKKERTYWNIKESSLDKDLIDEIQKKERLLRTASLGCTMCDALFLLLICFKKNLSDTAVVVCSIIVVVIGLCEVIIAISSAVKLQKLKKEALNSLKEPNGDADTLNEDFKND